MHRLKRGIKRRIKKYFTRPLWRLVKKTSWGYAYKKKTAKKRLDKLLFQDMPAAYNSEIDKPIQENKVVFIEPRYDFLSNNFVQLHKELVKNKDLDIHIHYLLELDLSKKQFYRNCKEMLRDVATAKYVFVNEASRYLSCVDLREETIVTQLWHACGAFKRFGFSTADKLFGTDKEGMLLHPYYKNYTHVTISSPEIAWAYEEAMGLQDRPEVIKPVGTSRTDIFFVPEEQEKARKKLEELMPAAKGKKVILFAPTFRGRVASASTPDNLSVEGFANAFSDEYILLFKHHPIVRNKPTISDEYNHSFAMDMTEHMTIDELLFVSDICISDYSSLIFEYSLLERPMLFFAYDLDEYFDWRGFYYDYNELTPGPICTTNEEMIDYIKNIDTLFDKQKVIDFKDKFMSACDGHATERILDMVFKKD